MLSSWENITVQNTYRTTKDPEKSSWIKCRKKHQKVPVPFPGPLGETLKKVMNCALISTGGFYIPNYSPAC